MRNDVSTSQCIAEHVLTSESSQISLVSHSSLKEVLSTSMIIMGRLENAPQGIISAPDLPSGSTASEDEHDNNQTTRDGTTIEKAGFEPLIIAQDSWLQWLGFFGSVGFRAAVKRRTTSTQLGFRFPSWVIRKALTVELITHRLVSCWTDISLSAGRIRLRNLVSTDSQLMLACYHGNLAAVKRYLETGKGSVNDMDTEGTTLLMVGLPLPRDFEFH